MRVETIGDATLYLGDCRQVLPRIAGDAIVTDPPYGVGFKFESYDDSEENWLQLMLDVMPLLLPFPVVVMPSCRIKALGWWYANFPPAWLIAWGKGATGHQSAIGFNSWEPHLIWGKPPKPMHDYFTCSPKADDNGHPCVKPDGWANWLVSRMALAGEIVCDPFMGAGTVGVACANLGRKFIGIEIEPKYFDIACERIAAAYAQLRLFA